MCKRTDLDILLGADEEDSERSDLDDELTLYFSEKSTPKDTNPFDWWKQNEFHFPL
jgi:hypothetical protein